MTTTTAEVPFEVFIECEPDNLGPNWRAADAEARKLLGRPVRKGESLMTSEISRPDGYGFKLIDLYAGMTEEEIAAQEAFDARPVVELTRAFVPDGTSEKKLDRMLLAAEHPFRNDPGFDRAWWSHGEDATGGCNWILFTE
jgi:hypothetical protein